MYCVRLWRMTLRVEVHVLCEVMKDNSACRGACIVWGYEGWLCVQNGQKYKEKEVNIIIHKLWEERAIIFFDILLHSKNTLLIFLGTIIWWSLKSTLRKWRMKTLRPRRHMRFVVNKLCIYLEPVIWIPCELLFFKCCRTVSFC